MLLFLTIGGLIVDASVVVAIVGGGGGVGVVAVVVSITSVWPKNGAHRVILFQMLSVSVVFSGGGGGAAAIDAGGKNSYVGGGGGGGYIIYLFGVEIWWSSSHIVANWLLLSSRHDIEVGRCWCRTKKKNAPREHKRQRYNCCIFLYLHE